MEKLGWVFWVLNGVVSVAAIFYCSGLRNANGVRGLMTPGGWIWVWQVVGVGLVPLSGWSPWHLLWWFPLGWIVCAAPGKALTPRAFFASEASWNPEVVLRGGGHVGGTDPLGEDGLHGGGSCAGVMPAGGHRSGGPSYQGTDAVRAWRA